MQVLIVDDDAAMRALLSSIVESQGYTVIAALADGSQVLDTIWKSPPDIVCLDYELPGRNGLDILREINESAPQVDVVFITGSDDPSVRHKAADAGAAGFIHKPFRPNQIIDELDQVFITRRTADSAHERLASREEPLAPTPVAPEPEAPPTPVLAPVAERPAPPAAPAPRFDRMTAVVADDNGSMRYLLKGLLAELGIKVVHLAANGADAVEAARKLHPGILCLDIDMPVMSGMEALPLVREASPQTAVVMVTGNASREFVEKATARGARGYILKPLRPAYVEAFVKRLLK